MRRTLPLLLGLAVIALAVPSVAHAGNPTTLPGVTAYPSLGQYMGQFYEEAIKIVGLAVFIMFLLAGLSFILPDSVKPSFLGDPKVIIQDAIIGMILLFAAYIILEAINPALVGVGVT